MKNHEYRNGQLIQTNKRFSQLTQKQKEWINHLLKEKYMAAYNETSKRPSKQVKEKVLLDVYEKIEEKGIWIPFSEVEQYFNSKISFYFKKANRPPSSF